MVVEYKDFETALERLEKIVAALEKGELTLEEAMARYEEGMNITQYCSDRLEAAERKVEMLQQDERGKISKVPFESLEAPASE